LSLVAPLMWIRSLILAAAVAAAISLPAQAAGPTAPLDAGAASKERSALMPVAVFGRDDRISIPSKYANLRNVIGLLFNSRSRTVCSAFCVGEDLIATAGHCLFKTLGEQAPNLEDFRFVRHAAEERDGTRIAGADSRTAFHNLITGSTKLSIKPPIDATSDWAIVRLAAPVCAQGHLTVNPLPPEEIIAAAGRKQIYQIAFHRDFADWQLAYSQPCGVARDFEHTPWPLISRDFSRSMDLVLHTCATGGASSGSPLLIDGPRGPEVVGINVGTYVVSRLAMKDGEVVRRFKPENVANTGVAARAFADKIELFQRATMLKPGEPLMVLQDELKSRRHYGGRVDGLLGPELRLAIQSYEQAEGLPVTGLATQALFKRLVGDTVRPVPRDGSGIVTSTIRRNVPRTEPSRRPPF